jgi:DNA-binding PadR family transcriptional regulator
VSVRHALLALLRQGPKYGLQLRLEFEERTGEVWPLNVGQVYTTLQRLERDGLVVADAEDGEQGPQRTFRLTDAGSEELERWLRTPPDMAAPPRDELVIKVLVALQLPEVDTAALVQVHRRQLVELMQQYTRLKEDAGEHELALLLVADSEIYRLDSLIRWLDSVDGRLKRRPPSPPSDRPKVRTAPERLRRRVGIRS